MNTLTIPFSGASATTEVDEVVVDMEDLVTLQQTNDTTTVIYVSNANVAMALARLDAIRINFVSHR